MDQNNSLKIWYHLLINLDQKQKKVRIKNESALYEDRELILDAFRSGYFQYKKHKEKEVQVC